MKIDSLNNYQIVTIALALLGGDSDHIDKEDIAIKANEIAPGKFNWRKYPNRIDLDAVSVALRDAKKPKNGELVVGSNNRGWMLSQNGTRWILSLNNKIFANVQLDERRTLISNAYNIEKERLYRTVAYRLFMDGKENEISKQDFFRFARINEYFKAKARERRYTIIENAVSFDDELSSLWQYLKNKYLEEGNQNV